MPERLSGRERPISLGKRQQGCSASEGTCGILFHLLRTANSERTHPFTKLTIRRNAGQVVGFYDGQNNKYSLVAFQSGGEDNSTAWKRIMLDSLSMVREKPSEMAVSDGFFAPIRIAVISTWEFVRYFSE
jgi:hypothetical protein